MGLYDRPYTRSDYDSQFNRAPQMRHGFGSVTPVVRILLIINVAVFLTVVIFRPVGQFVYAYFQLDPTSLARSLQLWRLVTYQFLHDPHSIMHILFNMLGLFFLGPSLERHFSSRRFLLFYLGCGVAGALFYYVLVAVNFLSATPMVGASGSVLGLLAACAILFPHFIVFILFFPVPIRVAAIFLTSIYIFMVLTRGHNAGGDAAHLAGMAAGAIYVLGRARLERLIWPLTEMISRRKMLRRRQLQEETDRILAKVHRHGIHSLSMKEKRALRQATRDHRRPA